MWQCAYLHIFISFSSILFGTVSIPYIMAGSTIILFMLPLSIWQYTKHAGVTHASSTFSFRFSHTFLSYTIPFIFTKAAAPFCTLLLTAYLKYKSVWFISISLHSYPHHLSLLRVHPWQARNQLSPQGGSFSTNIIPSKTSYYKHECNSSLIDICVHKHSHTRNERRMLQKA